MSQTNLTQFGENQQDTTTTDPFPFDDYGPTMDRPLPLAERPTLPGGIDTRQLPGTGLSPQDFALVNQWQSGPEKFLRVATGDWPDYHPDDRTTPDAIDGHGKTMAELEAAGKLPDRPEHSGETTSDCPETTTTDNSEPDDPAENSLESTTPDDGARDNTRAVAERDQMAEA